MCSKTHPGPKITPKTPQEGQNWPQCTSCGPINWFWAKKTKFESVRSKVCSFHSESAILIVMVLVDIYHHWQMFILSMSIILLPEIHQKVITTGRCSQIMRDDK